MGIIRKIYDKGEDTVNNIKKKYYNPLKEFEKEINNLKAYLKESKSLAAHINALRIRAETDITNHSEKVLKYKQKAEDTIKKVASKEIPEDAGEKISVHALGLKKTYEKRIEDLKNKIPTYDEELKLLKEKISDLKLKIEYYENEYSFLKNKTGKRKQKSHTFFYSDSSIITRLEKLKDAILKQNQQKDFYSEQSDKMYENINNDEIFDEYNKLKKNFKNKNNA
ncbi:MAG: PspA/IM30 family protein [Bacteroidales bacterium]|nr:PspA/IM30 family protein [Bacteroidales bacterium]